MDMAWTFWGTWIPFRMYLRVYGLGDSDGDRKISTGLQPLS